MRESTRIRHERVLELLHGEISRLPVDIKHVCFNDIYRHVAEQTGGEYCWRSIKNIANQYREKNANAS